MDTNLYTPEQNHLLRALHRRKKLSHAAMAVKIGVPLETIRPQLEALGILSPRPYKPPLDPNRAVRPSRAKTKVAAPAPKAVVIKPAPPSVRTVKLAPAPATQIALVKAAAPSRNFPEPVIKAIPKMLTVMELRSSHCKWPIGQGEGIRFCGCHTSKPPYCTEHSAIAFQEARPRSHRSRPMIPSTMMN